MFTKDFIKPEPVRPMIPERVRETVREAQAAGRRAEQTANLNMPFRARLKARDGVRPQSTLAIIAGIEAKTAPRRPAPAYRLRAVPSNPGALALVGGKGSGTGLSGGGHDDDGGSRLGDISQFAFAGLAVLGLAGLSVMAAESALKSVPDGPAGADEEAGPLTQAGPVIAPGAASSVAMAEASTPVGAVPVPWFDYRGVADQLAARKAAYETAQREAAAAEAEQAKVQAANAIAEAEANRLAESARQESEAEAARLAATQLEKTRLAEAEAARVAEADRQRLAELKAEQAAEAAAEQKRLAEIEAQRLAAAEAEAQRLADLKAGEDARAEQARLVAQAVENQRKRLAASAAEEARLAAQNASMATVLSPPSGTPATPLPHPRGTLRMDAHTGPVPLPATLKPARPALILASASVPVTRPVPQPAYARTSVSVRPFAPEPLPVSPRAADEFLAERVALTARQDLDSNALNSLRADFLALVDRQQDGASQTLRTPDGRDLTLLFEGTQTRQASKASVRPITYTGAPSDSVIRYVSDVIPEKVTIQCRDVSYAFPGQERGRFAACQAPEGGWTLARASDTRAGPEA